jgi:hypothetical protein
MADYVAVLVDIVPDAAISYTGVDPDYDDIEWLDERDKPSREECLEAWPALQIRLHNNQAKSERAEAYRRESDPLFFSAQRGECLQQDWIDKVTEIRLRYPYIETES